MSSTFVFGNKVIKEPGVYTRLISGVSNPGVTASFGKVLLIDTGVAKAGGAGISGEFSQGINSITKWSKASDFRDFTRKGIFWSIVQNLFEPNGFGSVGAQEILLVKAALTTAPSVSYTFTNGSITLKTLNEGTSGNGVALNKAATVTIKINSVAAGSLALSINSVAVGATYTIVANTSIADVVQGFANAIATNVGGYFIKSTTSNTLTISAPVASGATPNGQAVAVTIVGTSSLTIPATLTGGENNAYLTEGMAVKMSAGVKVGSYKFELFAGNFRGLDYLSLPFDGVDAVNTSASLILTSPEFNYIGDFVTWANKSAAFKSMFRLTASTVTGSGVFVAGDITSNSGNKLFAGGTETYNSTYFDQALDYIGDFDFTFCLTDNWGTDSTTGAKSANNVSLLYHLLNEAKFQKYLVVGGGVNRDEFASTNGSIEIAQFYNSNRVIVVHAGFGKIERFGSKLYSALNKAALVLGRICGLPPQVPATAKKVGIDSDQHEMNLSERELALDYGVLHTKLDEDVNGYIINQAITSLQIPKNEFLIEDINNAAGSHDLAVERILAQVNKLILLRAKAELFNTENGLNRFTLSDASFKVWVEKQLGTMVARDTTDNLLIRFQNVQITTSGDVKCANYELVPNYPVNKLCFTGIVLDA